MLRGKKIVVVMPAYNAGQTVQKTCAEVWAQRIVDEVILVDDASQDGTVDIARGIPHVIVTEHPSNRGGGGGHRHHGSSRLSIYAALDSQHGGVDRGRPVGVRAGVAHPRDRRAERWNAAMEIRFQSPADVRGEPAARDQVLGITHRLPRVLEGAARKVAHRSKLGRFRLRQPDAGPDRVGGTRHRRDHLPGPIFSRRLVHQLFKKRALRLRLSCRGPRVPPDEVADPAQRSISGGPALGLAGNPRRQMSPRNKDEECRARPNPGRMRGEKVPRSSSASGFSPAYGVNRLRPDLAIPIRERRRRLRLRGAQGCPPRTPDQALGRSLKGNR